MHIDRFLSKNRILDLKSRDLPSALDELIAVALPAGTALEKRVQLRNALVGREAQMQRRVGDWASLPNIKTPFVQKTVIAIGRLPVVPVASQKDLATTKDVSASTQIAPSKEPPYSALRVVFLVLVPEHGRNLNDLLTGMVNVLERCTPLPLGIFDDLKSFRKNIAQIFHEESKTPASQDKGTRWNRRFAKTAERLAKITHCQVLLFFADTFAKPVEPNKDPTVRTIIVSGKNTEYTFPSGVKAEVIKVSSFAKHRMSQLRAALFVGLMRGSIKPSDRVCCLGGSDGSDKLDSLIVVEVAQEFPSKMVTRANALVPQHVRPEVIERAIGIATELAVEGREGKPVGTMLVIGDIEKINPYVEQLVRNPFYGYAVDDRNLLDPFVEETIKEFAQIDGAFVVDGNGIVHSAGSRLTAVDSQLSLQSGLGTRHAAAAAISSVADCAAVCASSSGQVTLFRHGEAIVLLERSVSRTL